MAFINFYKRDTLYEEVWSEPLTAVAERYGVSEGSIRHACKRLEVPVPPRNYWTKVAAEKTPRKKRLPAYDGPQIIYRPWPRPDRPKPALAETKERLAFLDEEERRRTLQLCDNLQVKDRLTRPHPLIKQDQEIRAEHKRHERKTDRPGYWGSDYDHDHWAAWHTKKLDVKALPEDMPRACRLLNCVFHAIEELGGQVKLDQNTNNTQVVWLGEPMRIRLTSKEHDLCLVIEDYAAPRKNWRDTKRQRLEDQAGSFVIGLLECAHALRARREQQLREEQLRRQLELERIDREKRQSEETAKFQALEKNALDWQKARTIEQYVAELEKQVEIETDEEKRTKIADYVAWAKEKIAWLDPFVAREDPILGKRDDVQEARSHRSPYLIDGR